MVEAVAFGLAARIPVPRNECLKLPRRVIIIVVMVIVVVKLRMMV